MTEKHIHYATSNDTIVDDLRVCGCLNRFYEDFVQPTPEQIKALRIHLGLSQIALAEIVGATYKIGKGSTTVRKWETEEGKTEHRKIPYSAWRLLLVEFDLVAAKATGADR